MNGRIVDTNVWVVASGESSASAECTEHCFLWMSDFRDCEDRLIIDSASFENNPVPGDTVLQELRKNLRGGTFGRDLLDKVFMAGFRFEMTQILYDDSGAVLPDHIKLPNFEPADRKWVALHLEHQDRPPIHNAFDGDWIKHENDLHQAGIVVEHLCEAELRRRVADRQGEFR